jgi:hypothetical protein
MTNYLRTNKEVAVYVEELLERFAPVSPLTMTIIPVKSEGYSVRIATGSSSDDTEQEQVARFFSETQVNT